MSDGGDSGGGGSGAETPVISSPAEAAPEVAAPTPEPAIEIEAAPAQPEPPKAESASTSTPQTPAAEAQAVEDTTATLSAPPPPPDTSIRGRLSQALEALRFRKRAKLDKILILAAKKKSIKNDDVEKLLRVSDTTATNYLNELVRTGRLKRVESARQPTYELS